MGEVIRYEILATVGVDGGESVFCKIDEIVLELRSIGSLAKFGWPWEKV